MLLNAFTLFHVLLSLAGIGSGFVVLHAMLNSRHLEGWTRIFLATTIATSVTGFMFPFTRFLPSHAFGILSMILLSIAVFALYRRGLHGGWGRAYVITSMISLYLNVFVLIVQLFLKVPPLRAIAPTQTEFPFAAAQAVTLALMVALSARAARRFSPAARQAA